MSEDLRPVEALPLADLTPRPAADLGAAPQIEWVRPTDLFIEARYQRELSRRSTWLIRSIVENWNWSKFKPPVCSNVDGAGLVVIDGQHTAIAAACHPGITEIPVLVCVTDSVAERANAFVGHNKDRLAITRLQMHRAAVAAGEEVAQAVEDACRLAGVTILAVNRPRGEWKPGETVAVSSITKVVRERGRVGGSRILKILVRARQQPMSSLLIDAVFLLLFAREWMWKGDEQLADLLATRTPEQWTRLAQDVRTTGQSLSRSLAVELYRRLSAGGTRG